MSIFLPNSRFFAVSCLSILQKFHYSGLRRLNLWKSGLIGQFDVSPRHALGFRIVLKTTPTTHNNYYFWTKVYLSPLFLNYCSLELLNEIFETWNLKLETLRKQKETITTLGNLSVALCVPTTASSSITSSHSSSRQRPWRTHSPRSCLGLFLVVRGDFIGASTKEKLSNVV